MKTNQKQLNDLFASKKDVDVKFYVSHADEGSEKLCGEALRWFDALKTKTTVQSDVMELSYGYTSQR